MVRTLLCLVATSTHSSLTVSVTSLASRLAIEFLASSLSVRVRYCKIKGSGRSKDIYIIQIGCGKVDDHFIDLYIMVSACKASSAKRVTVVLPLSPYSRQPNISYNKAGAPL